MPRAQADPWDWSQITPAQAVGRVFPHAAKLDASLDHTIPGRYWTAGQIPPDATPLDRKVKLYIDKFIPRSDLILSGIYCPYYLWRAEVAASVTHAYWTAYELTPEARDNRLRELEAWEARLRASRSLLKLSARNALPRGSVYFQAKDRSRRTVNAVYDLRSSRFTELSFEVDRDELVLEDLRDTIVYYEGLLKNDKGQKGSPDVWRTAFYTQLAGLWMHTTGLSPTAERGALPAILEAATETIRGEGCGIGEWAQVRSLRGRIAPNREGEGFDLHRSEHRIFDAYDSAPVRGVEIRCLHTLAASEDDQHSPARGRAARAALELQGWGEGALATIMREVVRQELTRLDLLTPALRVQLGWVYETTGSEMTAALRAALRSATAGDPGAQAVIRAAVHHPEFAYAATGTAWASAAPVTSPGTLVDLRRAVRHRAGLVPDWHERDGDLRAAIAACELRVYAGPPGGRVGRLDDIMPALDPGGLGGVVE